MARKTSKIVSYLLGDFAQIIVIEVYADVVK
jgi:hypothetical protein